MSQPRFKPPKKNSLSRAQHQNYRPNLDFVKTRADIMCFSFNKQSGRPTKGGIFEIPTQYTKLSSDLAQDSPSFPQLKGQRYGNFAIMIGREKDSKNKFPAWMQKGVSNRLYIETLTEKTLEANCHIRQKSQSSNFRSRHSSLDDLKRYKQKLERDEKSRDSSQSDLERELMIYRSLTPIQLPH